MSPAPAAEGTCSLDGITCCSGPPDGRGRPRRLVAHRHRGRDRGQQHDRGPRHQHQRGRSPDPEPRAPRGAARHRHRLRAAGRAPAGRRLAPGTPAAAHRSRRCSCWPIVGALVASLVAMLHGRGRGVLRGRGDPPGGLQPGPAARAHRPAAGARGRRGAGSASSRPASSWRPTGACGRSPVAELQRGPGGRGATGPPDPRRRRGGRRRGVRARDHAHRRALRRRAAGPATRCGPAPTPWTACCGCVPVLAGTSRRIDAILAAVEHARATPGHLQRVADRFIAVFLPVVAGIAVLTGLGWGLARGWSEGLFNAMSVLLVACPCALGLATPLAVWRALGALARRGLVPALRGRGRAPGRRAHGGARQDRHHHRELEPPRGPRGAPGAGLSSPELLDLLARVEAGNPHPLAAAFVGHGGGAASPWRPERVRVLPGGRPRGRDGRARRPPPDAPAGCPCPPVCGRRPATPLGRAAPAAPSGRPGPGGGRPRRRSRWPRRPSWPSGARPGWVAVRDALRDLGLELVVMSGDPEAARAGLGDVAVLAGLGPEAKLAEVQAARAGRTARAVRRGRRQRRGRHGVELREHRGAGRCRAGAGGRHPELARPPPRGPGGGRRREPRGGAHHPLQPGASPPPTTSRGWRWPRPESCTRSWRPCS